MRMGLYENEWWKQDDGMLIYICIRTLWYMVYNIYYMKNEKKMKTTKHIK